MASNPQKNSTMAKLLLQNKPPPNHHQLSALSTSAATFRLVAAPVASLSSLSSLNNKTGATTGNATLIVSPRTEMAPLVVQQSPTSSTSSIHQTATTSGNLVLAQPIMIRFSEQQLAELSLKELNHYLRGLSKEEAAEVKRLRRAAKNKSYAVVQREKRMDDVQRLSARKSGLVEEISAVKFRKTRVADELTRVRKEANNLLALAKRLKIQVPQHVYELRSGSGEAASSSNNINNINDTGAQ